MSDGIEERALKALYAVRPNCSLGCPVPSEMCTCVIIAEVIVAFARAEIASAMPSIEAKTMREAASIAGTMAERPHDSDPAFSAVLDVEAAILARAAAIEKGKEAARS